MPVAASSPVTSPQALPRPAESQGAGLISIRGMNKQFLKRRRFVESLRHPFRREFQQALVGVTCDVYEGEFFGLLGPNGAGKTTLFKSLATFITPDSGTAIVGGYDLCTHPHKVRELVTPAVADERSLRWRLTARENLRLFAILYGVPRREVDSRASELLEAVGLEATGEKMVGEFSTGMKQRLLIARALIPRPRILLLDEPTRGLDPVLARNFRRFLREEIGRRHGCTVLLATHSAEEAFELCDRVAILDRGRLLASGSALVLRAEYGHQRYRILTRTPAHRSFDELAAWGASRASEDPATRDGWTTLEIDVPGGLESAAAVIQFVTSQGAVVAGFERVNMSLADLIERVVHRSNEEQHV
jgi:ABC-2 type transport system ATP-binding protein